MCFMRHLPCCHKGVSTIFPRGGKEFLKRIFQQSTTRNLLCTEKYLVILLLLLSLEKEGNWKSTEINDLGL